MRKNFLVRSLCVLSLVFAGDAGAAMMLGLVPGNKLVAFNSEYPGNVGPGHAVSGITAGQTLGAIALRQSDSELYGLGVFGTAIQFYRINVATFTATALGAQMATTSGSGNFSLDFNPVADVARVISDTGTNLRLNANTGALIANDTAITFAPNSYSDNARPTALAYSNNFAGAAMTTAYVLEYAHDRLFVMGGMNGNPSPDGGVITEVGAFQNVVDNTTDMGFDISPSGEALAILTPGQVPTLYHITLISGGATLVGVFPASAPMRDLVFAETIPEFDALFKNGFEP